MKYQFDHKRLLENWTRHPVRSTAAVFMVLLVLPAAMLLVPARMAWQMSSLLMEAIDDAYERIA